MKNTEIEINLIGFKNITNLSYLFYGCKTISSLPDISQWDTSNVVDMQYMFYGCRAISSLPDISNWNTSKVNNMKYMFKWMCIIKIFTRYIKMGPF